MTTIKKAQNGTIKKPVPQRFTVKNRDLTNEELKGGYTASQLEGRRKIVVKEQKNTPGAFIDYRAMATASKKNGGNIKKAKCGTKMKKK